ncbi:hypothetical protein [Nocardia asteroides]|uniref:hypothetical protein n=1 Tax=Nocardia asteroides TaxID=1824 RepID=UPI001E55BBBD|nr:hypothetical protein [Nocardia asteroides]UGT54221.1 hypothetical protein LTT85_26810 [Nocardia asteroides]
MTDHSFVNFTTGSETNTFDVYYSEPVGMLVVKLGDAKLFMPPVDAATLVDQLTAALNAYTATLQAVA